LRKLSTICGTHLVLVVARAKIRVGPAATRPRPARLLNIHGGKTSVAASSDWRRAIVGAAVGLLYGAVVLLLSIGAAGAGHGTNIPLLFSSAPFSLLQLVGGPDYIGEARLSTILCGTPLLWAAIGSLVALSGRRKSLRLAQALVTLHYVCALAVVATIGASLRGLTGKVPDFVYVWALFYLTGQVVLWWLTIRRDEVRPPE
jgi:hypothetical protein